VIVDQRRSLGCRLIGGFLVATFGVIQLLVECRAADDRASLFGERHPCITAPDRPIASARVERR
jgi:hypothetical protein